MVLKECQLLHTRGRDRCKDADPRVGRHESGDRVLGRLFRSFRHRAEIFGGIDARRRFERKFGGDVGGLGLDDEGVALPAAATEGGGADSAATATELVSQGQHQAVA